MKKWSKYSAGGQWTGSHMIKQRIKGEKYMMNDWEMLRWYCSGSLGDKMGDFRVCGFSGLGR